MKIKYQRWRRVLEWLASNAVVSVKQAAAFYVEDNPGYSEAGARITEKNARLMLCAMERAKLVKRAPGSGGVATRLSWMTSKAPDTRSKLLG